MSVLVHCLLAWASRPFSSDGWHSSGGPDPSYPRLWVRGRHPEHVTWPLSCLLFAWCQFLCIAYLHERVSFHFLFVRAAGHLAVMDDTPRGTSPRYPRLWVRGRRPEQEAQGTVLGVHLVLLWVCVTWPSSWVVRCDVSSCALLTCMSKCHSFPVCSCHSHLAVMGGTSQGTWSQLPTFVGKKKAPRTRSPGYGTAGTPGHKRGWKGEEQVWQWMHRSSQCFRQGI